jgi:curved DNA-binding protein CbpA
MKLSIQEAASFMGIELTISKDDLKSKYKELAKLYHPDISTLPNATELIQKLNNAFEILYNNVGIKSNPSLDAFFGFNQTSFKNQNEFFADFFKRAFDKTPPPTYERDDGFNTPPPQSVNDWKRASSGNLWKRRLDITAIIFPDKKHSRYRAMMVNDNMKPSMRKYYKEEFHSEEEAQIWAETYILGEN